MTYRVTMNVACLAYNTLAGKQYAASETVIDEADDALRATMRAETEQTLAGLEQAYAEMLGDYLEDAGSGECTTVTATTVLLPLDEPSPVARFILHVTACALPLAAMRAASDAFFEMLRDSTRDALDVVHSNLTRAPESDKPRFYVAMPMTLRVETSSSSADI